MTLLLFYLSSFALLFFNFIISLINSFYVTFFYFGLSTWSLSCESQAVFFYTRDFNDCANHSRIRKLLTILIPSKLLCFKHELSIFAIIRAPGNLNQANSQSSSKISDAIFLLCSTNLIVTLFHTFHHPYSLFVTYSPPLCPKTSSTYSPVFAFWWLRSSSSTASFIVTYGWKPN